MANWPKLRRFMRDKERLKELLATPIRADKFPEAEREEAVQAATEDRIEAAFALYGIPEEWPADLQWQQLAMALLGAHFKGCLTLQKGVGGPSEAYREAQRALVREFIAYEARRKVVGRAAREAFLKKNHQRCGEVRLTTEKGLGEAVADFRRRWPQIATEIESKARQPSE